MSGEPADMLSLFRLKPTRAAKVSEISESTAASATPPEERVNFHIGNPIQEKRLTSAYLRAALGLPLQEGTLSEDDPEALRGALQWPDSDRPVIELLTNLVRSSGPYLPRGGFSRSSPPALVIAFSEWLEKQQEPLTYHLGRTSGRREIILSSGGIGETLRIFFHALSMYLLHTPAYVLLFRAPLPDHVVSHGSLLTSVLPDAEQDALGLLRSHLAANPAAPTFVVLGEITEEQTRRSLRTLSLQFPLFFLEINDAPNHLSLAREARLIDRVIRFLTPSIFSPRFRELSLVFVAGNADYLALLETLHFQLKGTPSASEVELLTFLRRESAAEDTDRPPPEPFPVEPPLEASAFELGAEADLVRSAFGVERYIGSVIDEQQRRMTDVAETFRERARHIVEQARSRAALPSVDRFSGAGAAAIVHELVRNVDDPEWLNDLRHSFLQSFVKHHPEYDPASCTVVSGSARTALSLLGFHCGIRDVVIPDLSWTYEHCFPHLHAVPPTEELGLDTDAILRAVDAKIADDPAWRDHGAVVLNNPHNATGRVFEIESVRRLVRNLLERGVTVIDDLSYQNVAPSEQLPDIPTIRQIADGLVRSGRLSSEQGARVVTVHSVSKTDCLAGARLAVAEIRDERLRARFNTLVDTLKPNIGAILLTYLFYRNSLEVPRAYWRLRNTIFLERMEALEAAVRNLPGDRNPFAIRIVPPTGSMYPLMVIQRLPAGLSLDWVAAGLSRQGIGMIPLSTFARTEKGFETGRKSFRLTLGGTDGAAILLKKTRRVLIDLNRLVAEESAQYRRRQFPIVRRPMPFDADERQWSSVEDSIRHNVLALLNNGGHGMREELRDEQSIKVLTEDFLPERLAVYRQRFMDRSAIARELTERARADNGKSLGVRLEREFYKDDLHRREQAFRSRLFDRTVHPTQMFSLKTETSLDALIGTLLRGQPPARRRIGVLANEMVAEFLGLNVSITSGDEGEEIILDLDAHITAEQFGEIQDAGLPQTFLSFWGDWDGSNRPSGQGHLLVASVLVRNVARLSGLLSILVRHDPSSRVPSDLLSEIDRLPKSTGRFARLLQEITLLTHQLERRYRGILPFRASPGRVRQIGMALHLARDPVTSLWYHNDRLERRMRDLRQERRRALEYYFALNKRLRKELHRLIPSILRNMDKPALLLETVLYRDLLQRFLITPRIHQNILTAQDPFAIDTTVFNINEINEIGARHGNPGMVLALQVSMTTKPEAIIELDRKLRARREHVLRDHPELQLPSVWVIPLFEDHDTVRAITTHVNKLWEYALQSRRLNQDTHERFAELTEELFIAGSDLSQQVGQAAGGQLYRQAKYDFLHWLAQHGLAQRVRLKMGSGEPMQRQGGYYSDVSGEPAFMQTPEAVRRFASHLRESTRKSTVYATTPMVGVFAGGDLRTFQSAISEKLRHLPAMDFAQLLFHLSKMQQTHRDDLTRASEEFAESRLMSTARGEQALERLTVGTREPAMEGFLSVFTENFRQILYGRPEDVVGIHIISYFIARTTPPLRDRPTVRPVQGGKEQGNRILERIAETIPFSRYGSLLRAIAHNQAQTAVLGINQLTTGLFRALDTFSQQESIEGDPDTFLADRILPHLPVYEILQSLRMYHDVDLRFLGAIERAFPAGNSAFLALREDIDAMARYIPLFQQELLRRHGIDVGDFFEDTRFIPDLLPTLRPDLVALLQPDLFNTDVEGLRALIGGATGRSWIAAVSRLLSVPVEIGRWRSHAWALLERPVFQRVEAFVELAVSLYSLSSKRPTSEMPAGARSRRLPSNLDSFFRMPHADDEMRQFLAAAVEYLSIASEGMVEVPANIIRAMKEVERIAAIEEQALAPEDQNRLRFYLLQIARLAGESG